MRFTLSLQLPSAEINCSESGYFCLQGERVQTSQYPFKGCVDLPLTITISNMSFSHEWAMVILLNKYSRAEVYARAFSSTEFDMAAVTSCENQGFWDRVNRVNFAWILTNFVFDISKNKLLIIFPWNISATRISRTLLKCNNKTRNLVCTRPLQSKAYNYQINWC